MTFEAAMYSHLSDGRLATVGDDVYPERLPQGVSLPAVVYQLIPSDGPMYAHSGDVGLDTIRVQFDCWGGTYDAALAAFAELRAELSGYRGTWGAYEVGHVMFEGWRDDEDEDTRTHRRSVDAFIQYQPS